MATADRPCWTSPTCTHCCGIREYARARECACVRYLPVIYRPPPGHEGHKVVGFPTSRKVRHASYLILMRSRVQFHRRPLPLTFALFVNSAKRMEFLHESLVVSESKQVSHLQNVAGLGLEIPRSRWKYPLLGGILLSQFCECENRAFMFELKNLYNLSHKH